MAFDRKYPEIGDDILPFDKGQEDRVDKAFKDFVVSTQNGTQRVIKFDDGTMIISGSADLGNVEWDVLTSGLYPAKKYPKINYAVPFVTTPYPNLNGFGIGFCLTMPHNPTASGMNVKLGSFGQTPFQITVYFTAIGRWK